MLDKSLVHQTALQRVQSKMKSIQDEFSALQEALLTETKSSAGDKHETGRAMAQLEQEKLSRQLTETRKTLEGLLKIDPLSTFDTVTFGSLVNTSRGFFFISVGIGAIQVKETTVFCITAGSPVGQKILQKKVGDTFEMNGQIIIENIQ